MSNSLEIDELEINGEKWVSWKYSNMNYGITADRLKKWREGKGRARNNKFRYLKIGNRFLYSLEDINLLVSLR